MASTRSDSEKDELAKAAEKLRSKALSNNPTSLENIELYKK